MATPNGITEQLAKQRRTAEEADAKRRAAALGFPYLDVISTTVPTEIKALQLVPQAEAEKSLVAPLQLVGKKLAVIAVNPTATDAAATIARLRADHTVEVFVASLSGVRYALSYYRYLTEGARDISGRVEINQEHLSKTREQIKTIEDFRAAIETFESPLVSQVLEIILAGSLALHASDIHLEANEKSGVLRIRIDGLLHAIADSIERHVYLSLVSRVKLLSNLKLNIHTEAQDGRFTIAIQDRNIEIRTSVIPSEYGETIVLRLLDPLALKVDLESLGWRPDDLAIVKREIRKPNGLILNTGPTGSGKTTTLYAFLKFTFKPEIKVITIEDPIEYHLDGISQTQVNPGVGYTFASGLRSILRQDPNIILVGEIRDQETAEIAMNAALTGHIVFSTLHTNDAIGAIPRLIDLGAKPQVVGPALTLVIAQRLVRILCPKCRTPKPIDAGLKRNIDAFLAALPARVDRTPYASPTLYEPGGCDQCGNLGYRGRVSIFELFEVTEQIEQAIYRNPTEIDLKELSRKQGMTTMQEDGILKALSGITSIAEVERLTGAIVWPSAA
jgi:type IV pilus assembly protein PilB